MENEKLNLCELLKGYEGEEFYSPAFGNVAFRRIDESNNRVFVSYTGTGNSDSGYYVESEGNISPYGDCILFPSRALYEKYSLDAYSAWMEWKESKESKIWRAKEDEYYFYLTDSLDANCIIDKRTLFDNWRYNSGNYFRTIELANQAADRIKECLKVFHEQCQN